MPPHLKYSNPYTGNGNWYKGNLHAHSTEHSGCASLSLKKLLTEYSARDYDFLAITDHDHFTHLPETLQSEELLIIPGFEYSKGKHLQVLGVDSLIRLEHQLAIVRTEDQQGFVIINHPNWENPPHWPLSELLALNGYHAIEIYNGIINRLNGWSRATDIWDQVLSKGRRCWGVAADDSHELFDIGRAWVYVCAEKCSERAILNALRQGDFYASTGVILQEIKLIENKIHLETDEETAFRFIGPDGNFLKTYLGTLAEYWIEGWEDYVRVEGWNDQGWFWLQPFFGE